MTTGEGDQVDVRYANVVVPLDGSPFGDAALGTGRALAARFGAQLHAVTVADDDDEAETLREHAELALGERGGDRVHVVVGDDPAEAIRREAAALESSVVCLSTHGRGRVSGAVIGSVARALLLGSDQPLVAVGPLADRPPPFTSRWPQPLSILQLVACVDGSPASEAVLPVAASWARALDMSLAILTVAEPVPAPLREGASWSRRHGPDGDADEYVARLAEQWRGAAPEVSAHVEYDPIGPAEGVAVHLDRRPAGLVAVTTHARAGLGRVFLGAAAAGIVRTSVAPALVVPLPHEG